MELLGIHIHPLDDNEEADEIIDLLRRGGVSEEWVILRPDGESNSIFIPVEIVLGQLSEAHVRQAKLAKALGLLRALQPVTIGDVRSFGLEVAMRIHTRESYLPLPAEFVHECGRLGLDICVQNVRELPKSSF